MCFLHKSNKKCKESQGCHVLYIHLYYVTHAECQTFQLFNFVKSDEIATKLRAMLFPHKIKTNLKKNEGEA